MILKQFINSQTKTRSQRIAMLKEYLLENGNVPASKVCNDTGWSRTTINDYRRYIGIEIKRRNREKTNKVSRKKNSLRLKEIISGVLITKWNKKAESYIEELYETGTAMYPRKGQELISSLK